MRCTSDYSTNTIAEGGGFMGFPLFHLWMAEASLRILSPASHLTKARALKKVFNKYLSLNRKETRTWTTVNLSLNVCGTFIP